MKKCLSLFHSESNFFIEGGNDYGRTGSARSGPYTGMDAADPGTKRQWNDDQSVV